jgi:hypothetical protein
MFTTCFFCSADLGRNATLEAMPVGRRLAFNQESGRLWVVCRACERWNLSPLEERWEAIEACERLYRDTRKRVATDHVGLARVGDGLDLVRIGAPLRPEFAAWRYGDQFGRRRRRQLAITGAAVGAVGLVIVGGTWAGASLASFAGIYSNSGMWDAIIHGSPDRKIAQIVAPDGRLLDVRRRHARMSALVQPDVAGASLALRLEHREGTTVLTDEAAARAAQRVLPAVNRFGGSRRAVADAVRLVEEAGGPDAALDALARRRGSAACAIERTGKAAKPEKLAVRTLPGALHTLETVERLALEMALHEESERRALQGELGALAAAWEEAEAIAKIADGLLEPPAVRARLAALRGEGEARGRAASGRAASGRAATAREATEHGAT